MKANLQLRGANRPRSVHPGGAALIIVLTFLVLIAALVLAFFTSVSTELTGAKHYASGADAKQLADSAVQEVMGTIKLATSGTTTSSSVVAWASQPGMIRTFDSTGKLLTCYKLYSSDNTAVTSGTVNPAADYDPAWATKPALFTDLNSPVVTGTATLFPIIDGNAIKSLTKTPSGSTTTAYYGYDANGDGLPDIQGFSVNPTQVNYSPANPLSPTNTPVPMPVKWLYMLQDGTLAAPDSTSGTIATFTTAPASMQPTASNPITGRIAYWTDDDSCKVNINTASQGTYSDTPRSNSTEDQTLATDQPLTHEFQRYPGHPATTSLSPVFSTWWQGLSAAQVTTLNEKIYGIVPRVAGGGSLGGTVATTGTSTSYTPVTLDKDRLYASLDELMFTPLLSGTTRVTQGFTEAQLQQSRFFITANSRSPDVNLFNKPRVCIWPVSDINDSNHRTAFDQVFAFCSTVNTHPFYFQRDNADSPTNDLPNTVSNPSSPTGVERNRMLLDYLHYLTSQPIPGFGGNFQAKYSTLTPTVPGTGTDCDQILTEIFDYIRCTNLSDPALASPGVPFTVPGAAAGQGQVVPIQDNIRGTRGFGRFPTVDKAFFMFIGNAQNPAPTAAHMYVQPTVAEMNYYDPTTNPTGVVGTSPTGTATSGNLRVQMGFFMEFFTPSQGHVFIYPKFKVEVDGLNQISWGPVQTGTLTIAPSRSNPVGFTVIRTASAPTLPSTGTFTTTLNGFNLDYLSNNAWSGGNLGFASEIFGKGTTGAGAYPFVTSTTTSTGTVSGVVTATTSDMSPTGNIYFSGGNVTIKIYNAAGDTVVQTLTMNFPGSPAGGFPVPLLAPSSTLEGQTVGSSENGTVGNFRSFVAGTTTIDSSPPATATGGRLNSSGLDIGATAAPCSWIIDNDVVRSVEAASGDPRQLAALISVPSTYFAPNINYSNPALMMAHSLRSAANHAYYGATVGKLVQVALNQDGQAGSFPYYVTDGRYNGPDGGSPPWNWRSDNPVFDYGIPGHGNPAPTSDPGVLLGGSTGVATVLGDWDNGVGGTSDGPYINKPDEGDGNRTQGGTPYFEMSTSQFYPETTTFSPNRQIPSAVTFGSLPTGVFANKPWQTLLFRPLPIGHPGLGTSVAGGGDAGPPYTTPPDHLFLDLFNMPVVEPYPISEPLSTAGRINMNYQIVPFTYINRDTGIRAVMNSEKVIAIADNQSAIYKGGSTTSIRFPINMDETLKGFTARFNNNDIFRSASEICSINLVPQDTDPNATYANMPAYWWKTGAYTSPAQAHRLTGDNSRERPYATIYPRLTTKSNTYTVHFRVQILKKVPGSSATTWNEAQDQVLSEYRGSQTIERYVDASDTTIPDYADPSVYNSTDPTIDPPIDQFYKFRVLTSKKFSP